MCVDIFSAFVHAYVECKLFVFSETELPDSESSEDEVLPLLDKTDPRRQTSQEKLGPSTALIVSCFTPSRTRIRANRHTIILISQLLDGGHLNSSSGASVKLNADASDTAIVNTSKTNIYNNSTKQILLI